MYNTTTKYKEYIKKPSRSFDCRVKIGNRTFTNTEIIEIAPETVQPADGFSIGNTVSQSIDITLKNDGGTYASIGKADVEIGLKIGDSIEYIPIGTYSIDDVTKTDYTVKLTCYDNMIKFEIGYFEKYENPTLQQVVDQLEETTGVEFEGTLPNYTLTKLQGYTCREILAYVASICGGNAFITRDGKFTIKLPTETDYKITANNYFNTGYTKEDSIYKIGMITCQNKTDTEYSDDEDYDSANDKNTISVGSLSADTMELTFENPWVTEDILNDIYGKLKDFSYLGYSMKWQGDMSLDVGDIVTVVDKNNVERKALIYANKLDYTGGLTQETSAKGETKNSNSFSNTGSSINNIERLAVKLLIAEKAIINKASIKDLQATNARIENLDTNIANINTALINYASIDMLNAVKANISDLVAKDAEIANALINKADITQLNAANANISNLQATVADISTLVNGNLTSANIQSLVLTSDKVTVENGFIKNAMIDSLAADKITAGHINTDVVQIESNSGGLIISGATQQFKDKDNNVRLQIGQDAEGNFNFILVGEDGTSVLLDTDGIHENAIADGLIRTDMIADEAVTADKIDYESVFKGFNDDGSTYIKASKVAIDMQGQTLDVAFNTLSNTVSGIAENNIVKSPTAPAEPHDGDVWIDTSQATPIMKMYKDGTWGIVNSADGQFDQLNGKIEANTTAISAVQGQISTLISNTTITVDGKEKTLKDAYNGTVATVNSLSTTLGEHTSTLNALDGTVKSNASKITSIQTDLNGIKTSVSSVENTLNNTNSQLATLESTLDGFSSTVEKRIDNIKVGARNYILASAFQIDLYKDCWDLNKYNSLEAYLYNDYIYNALICNNTSTDWQETGQTINLLESETDYIFSAMIYGDAYIYITEISYDSNNNRNTYVITEIEVSTTEYTRIKQKFTTSKNVRYGYLTIAVPRKKSCKVALPKLEKGNIATDWLIAPEDVNENINIVEKTIIKSIDTTKSEIKQTTDSISNSVTSLQSKTTTIESALNNKADVSKITEINSSISSLTTNLNGITARTETLESKTSSLESSVKSNITEISALKGKIALKVEQTDINTAINSLNGEIQTSINSLSSRIDVQAGQISSKVSANDVGTIITQSPTQVMTAFNKISNYFEISANGAKFGNISSGDYTIMSDRGLLHHVGSSDYEYMYLTYTQKITMTIPNDTHDLEVTYNYDDTLLTLLNGRTPKKIIVTDIQGGDFYVLDGYFATSYDNRAWCTNITSTNFTIKGVKSARALKYSYSYSSDSTLFFRFTTCYGGEMLINVLILA